MQLKFFGKVDAKPAAEAAVMGLFEGENSLPDGFEGSAIAESDALAALLASKSFKLEEGAWREVFDGDGRYERIFIVGLGKPAKLTIDKVRQIGGKIQQRMDALKFARYVNFVGVNLEAAGVVDGDEIYRGLAEGSILAAYHYRGSKTDEAPRRVETAHLYVAKEYEKAAVSGQTIAEGTCFARDLVNAPANLMTPTILADNIQKMSRKFTGLRCEVWNKAKIEKAGMGLLLGVAQGSVEEPRFIVLEYGKPNKKKGPLVLVGKGVTFDTGGISIKPSAGMEKMKYDMGGSAAVAGAMYNIAALKLPGHFVGIIAATENMPSGTATKPGDVHTGYSGKTVEIINTDAEGRLILGDALAYAAKFNPSAVCDAATLTGACVIALGHAIGLMGNNDELMQAVRAASDYTGERAWPLPMDDDYADGLKSQVADLKNVGGREAGTITAAKFLEKFTSYPWVHLDIAGAAWEDKGKAYKPKGGVGAGVRLFTDLAKRWFSYFETRNKKKPPAFR